MKRKMIIFVGISLLSVTSMHYGIAVQEEKGSRVAAICLWTEDVPETAAFYVKLLGLPEQLFERKSRVRLKLDGTVLFILEGKPCASKSSDPFPLFALTVDDLDKAEIYLKGRNIKMPYGIQGSNRHRELQFYDPAGNLVELVQYR